MQPASENRERQPIEPSDQAAAEHERRLAVILGNLTDALGVGGMPDVEATIREHPELAAEIRSLWAAVLVANHVATECNDAVCSAIDAQPADEVAAVTADSDPPRLASGAAGFQVPCRFGDFELLAELGRGGMGVVYKARQISLGRIVALKMILRGQFASPADLARFRAEAQSVARLDDPHIVPVYEVGEHAGHPYFTMKYIAGTTLSRRLDDAPLAPREAAAILAPICQAIHVAHQRGVLHRDLKPSNILIDDEGRAHVTDFGLAKRIEAADSLTASGAILGTPCYMAPEQAAGTRGQIGPASDVYSLGTILYQMLTGRPPFQAATPVETVLLVLEQEPLPPRLLNLAADRELEMIALKCLQKPPALRYASAAELASDLNAYLHDEPISARSGLFSQVVARWFRETHHATVLENWGLLWMWHSLALLVTCLLTNWLEWRDVTSPIPYLVLWTAGLGLWAAIFWTLRRRGGPVTFVERQIAHVWAGSMISIALLFVVEQLLGLPVLTLSPVLGIINGMVFLIKAGILTGTFYLQAAALFATAAAMAVLQRHGIHLSVTLFGGVSAACFFIPGLKYHRQRRRGLPHTS